MQFEIRDDRLWIDGAPVPFVPSPNCGGRMEPSLVVYHDTAGRLDGRSSVTWLCDPRAKASAHVVVARDGTVTQLVLFDRVAWHAGQSVWNGRTNVNGFSIGIEIESPGRLTGTPGQAVAWFGAVFTAADGVERAASPACGDGLWLDYTEAQMAAVEAMTRALLAAYPSITALAGHHDIAPGRKVDPSPLFPWDRMRRALGNRRPPDTEAVAEVQRELAALGYWPGTVDGRIGPRTRSALRDFQEQNGLPITGTPDRATVAALFSEEAKPMVTGTRDEVTAKDLRAAGSVQARSSAWQKRTTEIIAATVVGSAGGVSQTQAPAASQGVHGASTSDVLSRAGEVVAQAETTVSTAKRAVSLADGLSGLVGKLAAFAMTPLGVLVLSVLAGLGVQWWLAHVQERARVRAARQGQHLGV